MNVKVDKVTLFLFALLMIACMWVGAEIYKLHILTNSDFIYYKIQNDELRNENKYLYSVIKELKKENKKELNDDNEKKCDISSPEKSIEKVLKHEGIYDNDPDDLGGETIYGITRKYEPDNEIWQYLDELKKNLSKHHNHNIDQLPVSLISGNIQANAMFLELAKKYYHSEWKRLKLDKIKYYPLADYLFDMVINNGEHQTVLIWSKALNSLNRPRIVTDFKYDKSDLKFNKDLINYSNVLYNRGKARQLLKIIKILRATRYIHIADKRYGNRKFLKGWLKRVKIII